jgi:hypothetical protein
MIGIKSSGFVEKGRVLAKTDPVPSGVNRVFTGMLINSDRELYLATSGNYLVKMKIAAFDAVVLDEHFAFWIRQKRQGFGLTIHADHLEFSLHAATLYRIVNDALIETIRGAQHDTQLP